MIEQCCFSSRIKFFEDGFIKKWGITSYKGNLDSSCIFVGMYDETDFNIIKKHKGFKVLLQTGSMNYNKNNQFIENLVLDNNMYFIWSFFCKFPLEAKVKEIHLPIKDYSRFIPNVMGDKIFMYLGSEARKNRYGYELAEEIKKHISFDIIYGMFIPTKDYKTEYYDNCFLNLNLSITGCGGFTTAYELGYMGRYSISTSKARMPMFIKFNNLCNIIVIIRKEARKIGTIQPSLMDRYHVTTDDWKNESFWE